MSQSVPVFRSGDRVCVMQTDEMISAGLANQHGVVITHWSEPRGIGGSKQVCRVQLADKAVNVAADNLMGL